jgi:O-methyltransferase
MMPRETRKFPAVMIKRAILSTLDRLGYTLAKKSDPIPDLRDTAFWDSYRLCQPYTMTSVERMFALYTAVKYALDHDIPGDFVECGVWRGGSAMLMARMLVERGVTDRKVYLYDTFEGMTAPGAFDTAYSGEAAVARDGWCEADLTDVTTNLRLTGIPESQVVMVKGKVEDTLPAHRPVGAIAVLRLDTDWYESTKHELDVLYPLLSEKGVLIIDDYGHWQGCRKAVDEYIRVAVKTVPKSVPNL